MKRILVFGGSMLLGWGVGAGVPLVVEDSVTMTQNRSTRLVTITYCLEGEPAVVTLDILTNGVSIGAANIHHVWGDVNRKVAVTSGAEVRTILWRPDKSWEGHHVTTPSVQAKVTAWATNAPPDYMVVDLGMEKGRNVFFYTCAAALPDGGLSNDVYRTQRLVMRKIPAAGVRWRMGSPLSEKGRNGEGHETTHYVTLNEDYYLGIFPVTQAQWQMFGIVNPSWFSVASPDWMVRPVDNVSYEDLRGSSNGPGGQWPNGDAATAHDVAEDSHLATMRARTGVFLDLPTDAQWEFACRAGAGTGYYNGRDPESGDTAVVSDGLRPLARCKLNDGHVAGASSAPPQDIGATNATPRVGSYLPNAWGLYDMLGCVHEWCLDWRGPFTADEVVDPVGPATGTLRVERGGAWNSVQAQCRCAFRHGDVPWFRHATRGFRLWAPVGHP